MVDKSFFITAIPLIDVEGNTNIPTIIFYDNKKVYIGSEAKSIAQSKEQTNVLNIDFKIDLGNDKPELGKHKTRFLTATGEKKSAGELTGDFIDQLLKHIKEWFANNSINEVTNIVIAEPLVMQGKEVIDDNWLRNYRASLKRILLGKGFTEDKIDFMPEPFAVFQYYKYGLKHPILNSQAKQHALVIDFGGGSFDICIIETDKEGEITGKRKNTKPFGASSAAIGGFFIDRKILEELFMKYIGQDNKELKRKIRNGINIYDESRREGRDLSTYSPEYSNFAYNFGKLVYGIEESKLMLCKNIGNWDLECSLSGLSVPVKLLKNPFSQDQEYFNAQLLASDFRRIFIDRVWGERLKLVVKQCIDRAKDDLAGAPISVVLLSGGSCNIGWLSKLIERDFANELHNAPILPLEDFQEVVAKGLAIECARKFYDENHSGDFASITYNRLHLVLDPDEIGYQLKNFLPSQSNPIQITNKPCVLLPSASILKNHFDKPLTWKIRLDKPPRKTLNYYFLRKGFNPFAENDIPDEENKNTNSKYNEDLLNIEHRCVYTPSNCSFDQSIQIQLIIGKESKTAKPKFIYKMGNLKAEEISVEGKPFYLDMTDTQDDVTAKAYIGLDFGTSNTSVSYVSQSAVQTYQKRATEKFWLDITELHRILPYPLASTLALHVREVEQSKLVKSAREFVEAGLALAAYISYYEMCIYKPSKRILRGFSQRSVGPLWKLLQDTLKELANNSTITKCFKEFLDEKVHNEIDKSVTFFGQHKHEKESDSSFNPRVVQLIANVSQKVFAEYKFGYFENVEQERFKRGEYKGLFRIASGNNLLSFVDTWKYKGKISFPNKEAFIVNFEKRIALSLQPLIFWYKCEKHPDDEHCFIYDKPEERNEPFKNFSFKAVGYPCSYKINSEHEDLFPIAQQLAEYMVSDPEIKIISF